MSERILKGAAWVYGDNVDTDVIIPARRMTTSDPAALAAHCMEDIDSSFVEGVQPGDVIIAGNNFGCGSSREHAPIAIKASGISCIVASSFARIFFRNAINIGLPILECDEAVAATKKGDRVEVNLATGEIKNVTSGTTFHAQPVAPFLQNFLDMGGLVPYVRARLGAEK